MSRELTSKNHLERLLGQSTPLSEIDTPTVNRYQQERLQEGSSTSSIRQELSMLSRMFDKARKPWGLPVENPVDDVERVKAGPARDRFLTSEEATIVSREAKTARNKKFHSFVILLMHTGMRSSEVARLHVNQVDLEKRSVIVKQTKSGKPRSIPLTIQAVEALKSIETDGYYFLKPSHTQNSDVMARPGNIFKSCWKAMTIRMKREGRDIPHFTPHDIRHTAASDLLMAGVDIRIIADILGHSTLQMVMRYTHMLDSHKQEVVDKISYLGGEG